VKEGDYPIMPPTNLSIDSIIKEFPVLHVKKIAEIT
jgi:hypothetical protein